MTSGRASASKSLWPEPAGASDPHAEVTGLTQSRTTSRPVAIVHLAFQIMVGIGSLLLLVGLRGLFLAWRNDSFRRIHGSSGC